MVYTVYSDAGMLVKPDTSTTDLGVGRDAIQVSMTYDDERGAYVQVNHSTRQTIPLVPLSKWRQARRMPTDLRFRVHH
jgi:hypothetical protein